MNVNGKLTWAGLLLFSLLLRPIPGGAQLLFSTNNGVITITGCSSGFRGVLAIPAQTNNFPVTSIRSGSLQNQSSLTSVLIPNSVTNIGSGAFRSCYGLTNVVIGSGVTNIGPDAFANCRALKDFKVDAANQYFMGTNGALFNHAQTVLLQYGGGVRGSYVIPNSVASIAILAFDGCTFLTSLAIPASVTNIGGEAFQYCTSLTNLTVAAGNPAFSSRNGVLFNQNQTWLVDFPTGRDGAYTIPGGVTHIGSYAFAYSRLDTVTIPGSASSAGDYAFLFAMLRNVYFLGDAPGPDFGGSAFDYDLATVWYLPGTAGWGATFQGMPAVLWLPQLVFGGSPWGTGSNSFGLNLTWADGSVVVVEACTHLGSATWSAVATNTLTGGSGWFSDPQWTNYPNRFYRLRAP